MALQIRRGLEADLPASPADGELLYATDTNKLYVGDGGTAQEISGGGGLANVVEDTTPQLGGDLDVTGHKLITTSDGNIELDPGGTGTIILHGNLTIDNLGNISKTGELNFRPSGVTSIGSNSALVDGNLFITRNSYSTAGGQGFTFAQHHSTADAVNFVFYRTRGTGSSPSAVQNGDDLADISFIGWDGTGRASGAAISATVEGSPSAGHIPTKMAFATDNGTTTAVRAELSPAGVWKVNNLQNYSGTDLTLTATTVNIAGDLQLNNRGDLKFADADSSNYVAFQAPAVVSSNVTWILPGADGAIGQVLTTDGNGTLSWATASSNGLASRGTATGTTASIADGATDNVTITGYKGYILYKINVTGAAWVRIYTDTASRTADASRLEGTDPAPGSGVIAEVITTSSQIILMSPGVFGFNNESSPTNDIPIAVTNKSGSPASFTVTLTIVQLEV